MRRRFGDRHTVGPDVGAGLVLGTEAVPDGLANGLLAGVNPVFGLYAYLIGLSVGSLSTSSALMSVESTSAMAVIIADVPGIQDHPNDPAILACLTLMTGLVLLVGGILRVGRLARFVSHAVLTGFVNAVAVSIILGQLDNLTGYDNSGSNKIAQFIDTIANVSSFRWSGIAIGAATMILIIGLQRTPIGPTGLVIAVVLTSAAVVVFDLSVVTLGDVTDVPRSLPTLTLPDFGAVSGLLVPALSLAFVSGLQGNLISATVHNPDGRLPDPSGDLRGVGVASLVSGGFGALPVGGSMAGTAIVRSAGARTRAANLIAGVTIAIVILAFSDLIAEVAMPALGGLLVVIGVRTLKPHDVRFVWRTGRNGTIAMAATFVLTLVIPLQYAVLVGVALSILMSIVRQANRIVVVQWVYDDESRRPIEVSPAKVVGPGEVVILMVHGNLFFAAAATLEAQLPAVDASTRGSVVILRLRGQDSVGGTTLHAMRRYAESLADTDSRLLLEGVGPNLYHQLIDTRTLDAVGFLEPRLRSSENRGRPGGVAVGRGRVGRGPPMTARRASSTRRRIRRRRRVRAGGGPQHRPPSRTAGPDRPRFRRSR